MSLIVGLNFVLFGVMLADSRMTWVGREQHRRDVCQKLFPFGGAGLISWCGHLDTARHTMRLLCDEKDRSDPWFALDETRVRSVLADDAMAHCPQGSASFIVQLINPYDSAYEGQYEPRVDMVVVDVAVPSGDAPTVNWERLPMKASVRGSGSFISRPMKEERLFIRTFAASSASPDFEHAVINKCLMVEREVDGLVKNRKEPTVGGLYQVAYILSDRVRAISYEKWVRCAGPFGTYARLAIEDGQSFQVHPQTDRVQRLVNPFAEEIETEPDEDLLFELEHLDSNSPGVMRNAKHRVRSRFVSAHGIAGAPEYFKPIFVPRA